MSETTSVFSLAASAYNTYPSEAVTCYLRPAPVSGKGSALVSLPAALRVEGFSLRGSNDHSEQSLYSVETADHNQVVWEWEPQGASGELEIVARVDALAPEGALVCQACQLDGDHRTCEEMELRVIVRRVAESMKYLPEIYASDDFTNRFLMLFESFWKPISRQIDAIPCYFDPHLTTPAILPWLAGWFGLEWDENLPEKRKRDLLAGIFPIYAHKGTCQALALFLKLFTGGVVEIKEHRDSNFTLGKEAYLGYQIALGTENAPHTFDVSLQVPAASIDEGEMERGRYRQRVEAMINLYKPAHTVFHLDLEFV